MLCMECGAISFERLDELHCSVQRRSGRVVDCRDGGGGGGGGGGGTAVAISAPLGFTSVCTRMWI